VGHGHVAFGSKSDIRLPRRDAGLHAFGRHSFGVIDKERGPLLPFFALYGAVFCALVICPSGLVAKRICFARDPNQIYKFGYPVPREGRWPSSRTLGWDAVDAAAPGAQT
jgi:hypothetical protein